MTHHKGRTAIALCGAAATLAFAVGYGPGEDPTGGLFVQRDGHPRTPASSR